MEKTRFFQILQQLPEEEKKQLERYVLQQAAGTDVLGLLQLLLPAVRTGKSREWHREFLFRKLYPDKKYNDGRMRFLTHELLRLAEDFLVMQNALQQQWLKQLLLLQQYRTLKLDRHFELQYKAFKATLHQQPLRNATYFWFSFQADTELSGYLKEKQNRHVEPQIRERSEHLDAFFLFNKAGIHIEALNYGNILKTDYRLRFTDLLEKVPDETLVSYPALALQLTALKTLTRPKERQHFDELKKRLLQHNGWLHATEYEDLMTLARNYCIRCINQGDRSFEPDLFELYRQEIKQLDEHLLNIPPVLYKNVVTLAINLNKLDWIRSFSETYRERLPEPHRQSLYCFNMAKYWFLKRQYDRVIELLREVQYTEMFDQLAAKSILLKAYFEKQEVQAFESLAHSFRVLVGDKKDLGYHSRSYLNFARFAEKLFLAPAAVRLELKKKMEKEKQLVEKRWLLEKTEAV